MISAICVCIEYLILGLLSRKHDHSSGVQTHRQHRIVIASFCLKLLFILIELGLAIAFGITEYRGDYNKSAIIEWILSLIFIFCESTLSDRLTRYGLSLIICSDVWSYILDFMPATRLWHRGKHGRYPPVKRGSEDMEMEADSYGNQVGGPVYL